jgi:hypothetical protein
MQMRLRAVGLRWLVTTIGAIGFVSSCAANIPTVFPTGLEPLEPNTVTAPAAVGGDSTPEVLNLRTGTTMDENGREYHFVLARGFIKASMSKVWSAMRTPPSTVDRREVTEYMVTAEQDPAYTQVWKTHNIVRGAALVEFDIRWRHGLAAGTESDPRVLAARWSKVFGSSYIEIMRGSASVTQMGANVCEVNIVYHLGAFTRTEENAAQYVRDLFGSWVALAHDRPLPTY